jgi:hypothetical protein
MKKAMGLLSVVLMLSLVLPSGEVAAQRSSGRGSWGGSHGSGGSYRGSPGYGGAPHGYYRPGHASPRYYGHGGTPSRYYGPPRGYYYGRGGYYYGYPGFGAFLPGLVIGGIVGWSLAPRYYTAPPYYYDPPAYYSPPPDYGYPPPVEGGQAAPAGGQLSIYPREGQTRDQQDRDHIECHDWAVGQSGFDPYVAPSDGRPGPDGARNSARYLQALEACLDVRGYTLR